MSTRPDIATVSPIFGGSGRHKPDDVKQTQGTYRPDRAKAEAQYLKVEKTMVPVAPDWIVDPMAVDYYEQAFMQLRDAGILTFADIGLVEIYAVERASIQRRYQQMYIQQIGPNGEVEYVVNPGIGPGTEKLNAFRMLSSELGFTPVSRHKVVGQKTKGQKDDPWNDV